MAYLVAQKIKDTNGTYMTKVAVEKTTTNSPNPFGDTTTFEDFAIARKSQGNTIQYFQPSETYYIRFKIHRIPQFYYSGSTIQDSTIFENADSLGINLVLTDSPQGNDSETIGSITVPRSEKTNNQNIETEEYISYSFIFTPSAQFRLITFQVVRVSFDAIYLEEGKYRKWLQSTPSNETIERKGTISSTKIFMYDKQPRIYFDGNDEFSDVCILNNLIPNNQTWLKIGYQSRPGNLIIVNKEPIIVGRSGIYELNNGTEIQNFMIASPNGSDSSYIDAFLLDYAYQE